jgi:hypothetical protein
LVEVSRTPKSGGVRQSLAAVAEHDLLLEQVVVDRAVERPVLCEPGIAQTHHYRMTAQVGWHVEPRPDPGRAVTGSIGIIRSAGSYRSQW